MRDLSTTEHHGDFHLVLLDQEPSGVSGLGIEVVLADAGPVLHFLQFDHVLLLLGLSRLLRHLELVLAVVHDADDRRTCCWSHFDKIESRFLRLAERRVHVHDAELRTIGADDANWRDADLAIDPHAFGGVLDCDALIPRLNEKGPQLWGPRARRARGARASLPTKHQQHTSQSEGRRVGDAGATPLYKL